MRFYDIDGEYFFKAAYWFRHLPIKHGFVWNKKAEAWQAKTKSSWLTLKEEISTLGKIIPENEKKRILEMSRASTTDFLPPAPEGMNYFPFQRAGIEYGMERDGVLIADPMGLGKTIQAIGLLNTMNAHRTLVICPSSLKLNWQREFQEWLVNPTITTKVISNNKQFLDSDIIIINYEKLAKYSDRIRQVEWDAIIVDEAHYIKSYKADRSKQVVGGKTKGGKKLEPLQAKKKIVLTGTPILNHPAELWNVCHWLAPEVFSNQYAFWVFYCGAKSTRFGFDTSGATNLDDLQDRLRSSIMVRRNKSEVLKDLPPKLRQVIEIEPTADQVDLVAEEVRGYAELKEEINNLRAAVASVDPNDEEAHRSAVGKLKQGISIAITKISAIRKKTALSKTPMMIDYIKDVIKETDGKLIVFAHHREVIDLLYEALKGNAVRLYGGMKEAEKQESVDRFQNDDKIKIFIGSIMAAGVGLTLTEATMVIFAELDWVPANVMQAEDRAHRMGQTKTVYVQHFVLAGSIDANMAKKMIEKQAMADKALDIDFSLNETLKL